MHRRNPSAKEDTEDRFLVPWALFAGVAMSFVACCVWGRKSAHTHQLIGVHRFHHLLTPESLFYPTASQVKQLALARTKNSRINVVVGGSSVLNGTGQQLTELWSKKLAALLGPRYCVVNLGFRGARTGEFGAIGAEMILARRRLIYLTDITSNAGALDVDGMPYRYLFWDAWYKGLIDQDIPGRNASIAQLPRKRSSDQGFAELRQSARLDSVLYFNDLWTTLAYNAGGTVWNRLCLSDSFKPRRAIRDTEPPPVPLHMRYARMLGQEDFERLRTGMRLPMVRQDSSGQWITDADKLEDFRLGLERCMPNEELRHRTIAILHKFAPRTLSRMSPVEREHLAHLRKAIIPVLEVEGMRTVVERRVFSDEDYADHIHLTPSGGEKLAALVAPAIRELSKSLGYLEAGEEE